MSALSDSDDVLRDYASDFGNLYVRKPTIVARPENTDSLRECLSHAHNHDLKISIRGAGQSFAGQSICEGGMVVDMTCLINEATQVELGGNWINVAAGVKLHDLQTLLRAHDLRLPVYTSSTEATLGGTLAAGGISGRSYSRGLLANHVSELKIMGADGRIWPCALDQNKDIFSTSLATMGVNGVILEAKLAVEALKPYRAQLVVKKIPYQQLPALIEELKSYTEISSMEGFVNPKYPDITVDLYCGIEAANKSELNEKLQLWRAITSMLSVSNAAIRSTHIDDPLGFSESIGGWSTSGSHGLRMDMLNKKHSVYAVPVPTAFSMDKAGAFLEEFSAYVTRKKLFFMSKPYFAIINSMQDSALSWLHLAEHDAYVIAFDLFVSFPYPLKKRGIHVLDEVSEMTAKYGARLYPYGYIPEAGLLSRLLPGFTAEMQGSLQKTDPKQLIHSPLSVVRAV